MEKINLEYFPVSESARRMLSYVSDGFYDNSYVGKWLFQVMGAEYDEVRERLEQLPYQLFPETATWGLVYHEIKWGLPVRENLPYEERRRLIYQKRDFWAPMTPYRMEIYLANATGFEVHVADIHNPGPYGFVPDHPNRFKVYFVGDGMLDMGKIREKLQQIKQSHTVYSMNYRTEIALDCREVERVILRKVALHFRNYFYDYNMLDGRWLLDGSVLLNARRPCRLKIWTAFGRIRCRTVSGHQAGVITAVRIAAQEEAGNMRLVMHAACRSSKNAKKVSICVRLSINGQSEAFENVSVREVGNLWVLDGSVQLNGEKLLNAVYREESL